MSDLFDGEVDLSVVLPAHNEITLLGSTVTNLVSGLGERGLRFEIVVVENGSHDGTLRLARLLAAQLPEVRVLALGPRNYGEALAVGLSAARGRLVALFDVDYYDLSFLDEARRLLEANGLAMVVASKRAPGADDRRPLTRRLLTAGFAFVLRHLVELPVSDAHGMKLLCREVVEPVARTTRLRNSMFDVELCIRCQRAGLSIGELPATVVERRPPRSSVAWRTVATLADLLRLRLLLGPPAADGTKPGASPRRRGAAAPVSTRAARKRTARAPAGAGRPLVGRHVLAVPQRAVGDVVGQLREVVLGQIQRIRRSRS